MNLLKEAQLALIAYADENHDVNDLLDRIEKALTAPAQEDWGPGPHECHSLPAPAQPAPVQEPVGEVIGTNEYAGFGQIKHVKTIQWRGEPAPIGTKLYTAPPAQPAPVQQETVAWVLLRKDEDGLEPVMFYGGKQKPEGEFKDRFTLRPVCFADESPPAQRTWVSLTHEEKQYLNEVLNLQGRFSVIDAIAAKLEEKNNG